jgi:GxxExxY protein
MPIEVKSEIIVLDQPEFYTLNPGVLRVAFDVHNEFGRFLDEALYKNEIAARWEAAGLGTVQREVQINLINESFRKTYFMDLLFNNALMLEAKAAESLTGAHRAQGLNYMFLAGLKHALLANFRPERVEHEFLSTSLTQEERRRFKPVDAGWQAVNDESRLFRERLLALISDWGAFLESSLYREAMTHFFGGAASCVRPVAVYSGDRLIGSQAVHFLTDDTAFAITSMTRNLAAMAEHQTRFLRHTPLKYMQWANLNRHDIEFRTLTRQ